MNKYDDIIHLSRPKSRRPPMPIADRAAQFAPFAALAGHNDAIKETARYVSPKKNLSDSERNLLDQQIAKLKEELHSRPHVKISHFVKDASKNGGTYETVEGNLRLIDNVSAALIFEDGRSVLIEDIYSIHC